MVQEAADVLSRKPGGRGREPLDSAMDGLGADGMAIARIRGPLQARARAKAKWEGKHDKSLVDRISSELHGSNKTLALQLLKGERDEQGAPNPTLAQQQAETLHKAARGMGTDDPFYLVLAKNSPAQNIATRTAYENKYGRSPRQPHYGGMSGNLAKCLQALLLPPADYAMRLRKAFVGLGTSDVRGACVLGGHDKAGYTSHRRGLPAEVHVAPQGLDQEGVRGQLQAPGHGLGERARRAADPDAPIEIPEETSVHRARPPFVPLPTPIHGPTTPQGFPRVTRPPRRRCLRGLYLGAHASRDRDGCKVRSVNRRVRPPRTRCRARPKDARALFPADPGTGSTLSAGHRHAGVRVARVLQDPEVRQREALLVSLGDSPR